jgi:LppX_LprAFG lipoprotein
MRRRSPLFLVLLALVLALPACGGDDGGNGGGGGGVAADPDASPQEKVAAAAEATTGSGSSKLSFSATVQVPAEGGTQDVQFTGEGEFDYEGRRGRLTYDLTELLEAQGQEGADGEAEIVFDGTVFYMRFPTLESSLPEGKTWVRFDLQEIGEQEGIDLSQLSQLNQDPAQMLDYLRATSSEIEEVGQEEVRGDQTTHYRATIDLDKVPDQAPEDQREGVRASIEALKEQLGTSTMPVEVWIDEDGRLRRFTQSVPSPGGDVEVTMELYDFGTDVEIDTPPEDETVDFIELLGQGG